MDFVSEINVYIDMLLNINMSYGGGGGGRRFY